MIAAALTIAGLILTLAQFKLFKRPINGWKVTIFILLFLSSIDSIWDAHVSEKRTQQDSDTIQVSKRKIDSLGLRLSEAKQIIIDTVRFCSQNGIKQTILSAEDVKQAVALGVKQGIEEAKEGRRDIKNTIKDSIKTLKPAFIQFVNDTARTIGFNYGNDTMHATCYTINSGDLPAFNVSAHVYVIACTKDQSIFELKVMAPELISSDLPGNTIRFYPSIRYINQTDFNSIDKLIFIIKGDYYMDYELKKKHTYTISKTFFPAGKQVRNYGLAMPIETLLKIAKPVYLDK